MQDTQQSQVPAPARKRWPRRHPVWTTLICVLLGGVTLVIALGAAVSSMANQALSSNHVQGTSSAPHSGTNPGAGTTNNSNNAPPAPPAPSGPEHLAIGQAAVIGDSGNATEGSVTVKSVNVTQYPADSYGEAPANGYYVIVHVSAKADPSYTQGFDINSLDFNAVSHGQQYQEGNGNAFEALSNNQSGQDITTTLAAGNRADGWIAFDVHSPHGKIVYAPNLDGQPLATWRY
jgi:hypothetical protein